MDSDLSPVLIANRGEIAVRIARTVRALGLASIGVFTDADTGAPHIDSADEAVRIGSYLDAAGDRRRGPACRRAFRPSRLRLPQRERRVCAGRDRRRSDLDRPAARRDRVDGRQGQRQGVRPAGRRAGRPARRQRSVPAWWSRRWPAGAARVCGWCVRRRARRRDGRRASVRRWPPSATGGVIVERWIERPRHIEIQVFADAHGNVVHFGERECSLQRRHQKVVEECPSPVVDEELRQRMGAAATALRSRMRLRRAPARSSSSLPGTPANSSSSR